MYDDLGALKVTDFGLSRVLTPGTLLFGKRGTPRYMAPEMYRDEGYNGAAADVWALGILLHAVIKGSFPFQWQMMKVSVLSLLTMVRIIAMIFIMMIKGNVSVMVIHSYEYLHQI